MSTLPNDRDDELSAFADEQDRGEAWVYPRNPDEPMPADMPNPLVVRVTKVSTGPVKGEEMSFLNGVDADGKRWSRLIGAKALKDTLLDGVQSEWNEERRAFVETGRIGPVQPGELVSIRYAGWREIMSGPYKGKLYPDLKVRRKPPEPLIEKQKQAQGITATPTARGQEGEARDDIPW